MDERRAAGTFLLAHLSDVHLPLAGFRLQDATPKRLLGWVNWQHRRHRLHRRDVLDTVVAHLKAQRPDHILVSGDLTNVGAPAELEAALTWLQDLGPPAQVTVIPGNHDVYGRMWRDPGLARWQPYMCSNAAGIAATGPCRAARAGSREAFPFVRVFGRVALIGASSAAHTPPFFASGRLGAAQTARLQQMLHQLGSADLARVVAIHHAPLPGLGATRGLDDAVAAGAALAEAGAELVLHGHHHRFMQAQLARGPAERPVPVIGVPSASAAPGHHHPGAGYHLFRFAPGAPIAATAMSLTATGFAAVPIALP